MTQPVPDRPGAAKWRARMMAARRRTMKLLGRPADPYPRPPSGIFLSPSESHRAEMDATDARLSYAAAGGGDVGEWQGRARAKLAELCGYTNATAIPEELHSSSATLPGGCRRMSCYLRVAPGRDLPVHVISGPDGALPSRVMICLHGTNSGAHLAWGETRLPADHERLARGAKLFDGAPVQIAHLFHGYQLHTPSPPE